jgi:hypothetical protein
VLAELTDDPSLRTVALLIVLLATIVTLAFVNQPEGGAVTAPERPDRTGVAEPRETAPTEPGAGSTGSATHRGGSVP